MGKYLTKKEKDLLRKHICALLEAGMDSSEICNCLGISKDMLYRLRINKEKNYKRIEINDYDPEWKQFEMLHNIPGFPNGIKLSKGLWCDYEDDNKEMVIFLYTHGILPSIIVKILNGRLSRATVYRIIKKYQESKNTG